MLVFEIEDAEHFHSVRRHSVFVMDNTDMPEAQRLNREPGQSREGYWSVRVLKSNKTEEGNGKKEPIAGIGS